jgi:predicted MFS family arabinose efflux permease
MDMRKERNVFLQVVFTLGIGSTLVVSLLYVTIPLLPIFEMELQATSGQTVWASSIYGIAYAIGCLIFGIFSDRFHRKSILIGGIFALIVTTYLVNLSQSIEWLIAFRLIQGIIAASIPIVSLAYINDVLAPRYRSIAITILSSSFLLAGILGQLYGQVISNEWGWQAVFLLLSIGYLFIAFLIFFLPNGLIPKRDRSFFNVIHQAVQVFKIPRLVFSFLVMGTILFSFVAMYSGLGPYVNHKFHLAEEDLMWIRIAGIPGIAISLFASLFMRRYGVKTILIVGLLIAAAGLSMEVFAPSVSFLVFSSVIFVMGISIANPSMIVIVGQLGEKSRGSAFAINAFSAFVGASFGSLIAEYISSFPKLCLSLILTLLSAIVVTSLFIHDHKVSLNQKTQ